MIKILIGIVMALVCLAALGAFVFVALIKSANLQDWD